MTLCRYLEAGFEGYSVIAKLIAAISESFRFLICSTIGEMLWEAFSITDKRSSSADMIVESLAFSYIMDSIVGFVIGVTFTTPGSIDQTKNK